METVRMKLREWREADRPLLAAIHANPEVMQFLGGTKTAAENSDVVDQLMKLTKNGEPTFWAAELKGDSSLIGAVGLHWLGADFPFGPALEVGWRLGRDHWGKGYATEAVILLVQVTRNELRYHQGDQRRYAPQFALAVQLAGGVLGEVPPGRGPHAPGGGAMFVVRSAEKSSGIARLPWRLV